MNLVEVISALEPRHALAVVMALSIILYAIAANIAWANRYLRPGRIGRWVAWLKNARFMRALGELVRWTYYLALPWATLVLGYSSVRALGVWNLDWLGRLPSAVALGVGAGIVFVWVWYPYAREEQARTVGASGWTRARRLLELVYQEAHWALYRAGPILWLNDFYWGSFIGLGIVFLEGWTNPAVRTNVQDITRADAPLWDGSLAVVSTITFVFTQNLWYCLLLHLLLDQVLRAAIGFPGAQGSPFAESD